MNTFGSFEKLMQATRDELLAVPDVGGIMADSILEFFGAEENRILIARLGEAGLQLESDLAEQSSELAGRTYAVTGDVTHFKNRNELVAFIERRGGKCAGSVSKKTYALINNDSASQSSKNKKARSLGIPIITEDEFLKSLQAPQSTEQADETE